MKYLALVVVLFTLTVCDESKDLACNAVRKDSGFICVCNKTYCDTIERPRKLKLGQYHVYSTSNSMPGFNHFTSYFNFKNAPVEALKLKLDSNIKLQKIRGFGSSFTDSVGYSFNRLSRDVQNNFLKSHFSVEGIEYSLCRVVLGSSDFSSHEYTYVPEYDPSLSTFNLTDEDYTNKIWLITRANAMSERKINLLGSTWTAPPWMKTNRNFTTGYLKVEFEQAWADYHVKALDAFKKEGVNFWGLTTGNEPVTLTTFRTRIPNLAMFPEQQRDWIGKNLGPSLEKHGYANISLIVLDDQRKYAYWWMNTILNSVEARKYVNGIGIHWYMDAEASPLIMDQIHSKYPEQEIIYTESSINPAVSIASNDQSKSNHRYRISMKNNNNVWEEIHPKLGDWRRATLYITSVMESLLHWTTGYIDWNLALDMTGGPTGMGFTCDAPIIINYESDEFYKQPMFYAMGHFSKFLQPGSVIIDVQSESTTSKFVIEERKPAFRRPFVYSDVTYIAALNPDETTTIIMFNPKNTSVAVSIDCGERGYAHVKLHAESLTSIIF